MIVTEKLLQDRSIEVGDCLIWQQSCNADGYPIMSLSSKRRGAPVRREAYKLYHGEIPKGKWICPTCDNKSCISRHCLKAMTRSERMKIAGKKGVFSTPDICAMRARSRREATHRTMEDARKVRADVAAKKPRKEIANEHGISLDMVSKIVRNKAWREGASNNSVFNMAV